MASHMKTTVHIPDALFAEAQALAAKEKTTLKALIAEGLRHVLRDHKPKEPHKMKDCSFPPADQVTKKSAPKDWSEIVSLVYGDRGG